MPFETFRTICRRNVVKARRIVSAMDLRKLAIRRAAHTRIVGRAVMAPSGTGELRDRTVCGCLERYAVPIECR